MGNYIIRRLLLLPLTLFAITFVNFVIINMAPGDPSLVTEKNLTGEAGRDTKSSSISGSDFRYLSFREWYGLTLPILFNNWPAISEGDIVKTIEEIEEGALPFKERQALRLKLGDQSPYLLEKLVSIMNSKSYSETVRLDAVNLFVRGALGFVTVTPNPTKEDRAINREISERNIYLESQLAKKSDSEEMLEEKIKHLTSWYETHEKSYSFFDRAKIFFFETRFYRYFSRVLTLDFGTLRDDPNKSVIREVTSRFKYSLTLSILPMLIAFFLCMIFGTWMALRRGQPIDNSLNFIFLFLYAIPIFVMAPFLIEEVAMRFGMPFSGFTSPESLYRGMNSLQRLLDIGKHIAIPIVAILYGMLAAQSRLARTAVLEVAQSDYVRFAKAKGLGSRLILFRYIGRNAAITLVTSIAGSLGVILGGSLIVETLFEIDGFGKFFYEAVVGRDYNVIMFSALAGSFLGLVGYLAADIAYASLDPRVTLE